VHDHRADGDAAFGQPFPSLLDCRLHEAIHDYLPPLTFDIQLIMQITGV
jgi:hypothetical protein